VSLIPNIRQYMTPTPKTIAYDQTLEVAGEYMRKLHLRHLPVTRGGRPIGIVTDRDIRLILSVPSLGVLSTKVEAALTASPCFVSPDTSLTEAASHMVESRFGCVLVMDQNRLVGIFTATDALRALSDTFRRLSSFSS
jgi:acetoin utilization protein AcuB